MSENNRSLKNYQYSIEGQKFPENLAPVVAIISGNSLVFSRRIITSTGFYRYCAPGASAPVVAKNQSPKQVFVNVVYVDHFSEPLTRRKAPQRFRKD